MRNTYYKIVSPEYTLIDFYLLTTIYQYNTRYDLNYKIKYSLKESINIIITKLIDVFNHEFRFMLSENFIDTDFQLLYNKTITERSDIELIQIYHQLMHADINKKIILLDKFFHVLHNDGNICDRLEFFYYNRCDFVSKFLEFKSKIKSLWSLHHYSSPYAKLISAPILKLICGCGDNVKLETYKTESWEDVEIWKRGLWDFGVYQNKIWEGDIFENSGFIKSVWKDGMFRNGTFKNSMWLDGFWKSGIWENSFWKTGKIYDPNRIGKCKNCEIYKDDPNYIYSNINPNKYFN